MAGAGPQDHERKFPASSGSQRDWGLSHARARLTAPQRLLELVGGSRDKGSRVAAVRTADVRGLGLRVVPKPLPEDPGHAEIQSARASLDDHACRKKLSLLFHFLADQP
jgi:hypothetical protein